MEFTMEFMVFVQRVLNLRSAGLTYREINDELFPEYGTVSMTKSSAYRILYSVFKTNLKSM